MICIACVRISLWCVALLQQLCNHFLYLYTNRVKHNHPSCPTSLKSSFLCRTRLVKNWKSVKYCSFFLFFLFFFPCFYYTIMWCAGQTNIEGWKPMEPVPSPLFYSTLNPFACFCGLQKYNNFHNISWFLTHIQTMKKMILYKFDNTSQ